MVQSWKGSLPMQRPQKPFGWQTGMLTLVTGCLVAGCVFATWGVSHAGAAEPSAKKKVSGKVVRAAKSKIARKLNGAKAAMARRDEEQQDSKPAIQIVAAGSK